MSRAGVQRDISERVLGHAIGGVEGIYDRYEYLDEKSTERWAKLAALMSMLSCIRAQADVLPMKQRFGVASL